MRSLEDQRLIERLTVERDAAQKCCAEMRDLIEENLKCIVGDYGCLACKTRSEELLKRADCGKGYVRVEEWKPVVEALDKLARLGNEPAFPTSKAARAD